jgi:hypothetical protein
MPVSLEFHHMRTLGVLLVVATTLGGAAVSSPADAAAGCRSQWTDLASLHGENGNPDGSATVLVERWDAMYEQAWELAETAGPDDCGPAITTFARKWGGLESLMYDLHTFDMPLQLAIDEGDRRHWIELQQEYGGSGVLPEPLQEAFHRLRRQAPRSYADLATVLAGVPDVPVGRPRLVEAFVSDVAEAARDSRHYQLAVDADRFIDNAELSEE